MCSWQTVDNIRVKTRRPWNWTVDRIFRACGYERVLRRIEVKAAAIAGEG